MPGLCAPSKAKTLVGLCLLEFLSWGILFYTLPISSTRLANESNWPAAVVPTVYTLSLLCSGLAGPFVGRLIDAIGPRCVMFWGAALGALAMIASSQTDSIALFALAWMVAGASQAATLYPPAFAAAAQWFGTASQWPVLLITFAGGLSSTAFGPITAYLVDSLGWRTAFVVLGAGFGMAAMLCAAWLLREPWASATRNREASKAYVNHVARSSDFRYAQIALTIAATGLYATTLNLIPLLEELGFGYQEAAAVFGALGAAQLLGRLAFIPLGRLGTPRHRLSAQILLCALALLALALTGTSPVLVIVAAVATGAVRGAQTLAIATTVSDRWGKESYATIYGKFNFPIAISIALSPLLGELVASALGSYQYATLVFACASMVAVLLARRT